jgi:hypothetical protein
LENATRETRKNYFYWAYTYYKALRVSRESTGVYLGEIPAYEQGFYDSWLAE